MRIIRRRMNIHRRVLNFTTSEFTAMYRVGQKTGPFLNVDNFATVSGREACGMPKVSKFCLNILTNFHSTHKETTIVHTHGG